MTASTLTIEITRTKHAASSHHWTVWQDNVLVGEGRCLGAEAATEQAMDLVADRIPAEQVDHIEIINR